MSMAVPCPSTSNILQTTPAKPYVNIPSGVHQSVQALKTQINIPNIHENRDLDDDARIGRKRGRDEDMSKAKEYHFMKPMKRRKQYCQLTNLMIAENTGAYSDIRTPSSCQSVCSYANGCLECYYGNTCCPYGNYYSKGLPIGYHSDVGSANQNRFFSVPSYPVQFQCQPYSSLIVDRLGKVRLVEPTTKRKVASSESGPVIIECFSLNGKNDDRQTFLKEEDSSTSTEYKEVFTPKTTSVTHDSCVSKSNLDNQPTLMMADRVTTERKVPKANSTSTHRQQPQVRELPVLSLDTKWLRHHDEDKSTGEENIKYGYKHPSSKKQTSVDFYEIYHSRYYKHTHPSSDSSTKDQDNQSHIQQDGKEAPREQDDQEAGFGDTAVPDTINTGTDKCVAKAIPGHMGETNIPETQTSLITKHSQDTKGKEGSLEIHGSKTSGVQTSQIEKNLAKNDRSSVSEENIIVNHKDLCDDEIPLHRDSVIKESPDSSSKAASDSDSSQCSPSTKHANTDRWIPVFLTRDAGHHHTASGRHEQNIPHVVVADSNALFHNSFENSLSDAMESNNLHFSPRHRQNTPKTLLPERPAVGSESIDRDDEHCNQSQSEAIYFLKESSAHPVVSCSTNLVSQPVHPCSPDSLSGDSWEKINQEMYQGTLQNVSRSKSYICKHCGREFSHVSSLNNHIRRHTGLKPFRCRYCGKRFAQSGVLTAHLRTHTGDRPFECVICKKRFAQTTTLANHIRTHTGHKPFSCKYCKRKFAQSSTRNKHELSHTKEKPYICKYCGRTFAQSATVTRHMRIHMRQDGFLCIYCGKEFPYLHALDKHLDSHSR